MAAHWLPDMSPRIVFLDLLRRRQIILLERSLYLKNSGAVAVKFERAIDKIL
jgi:hypothetical protein